MRSTTILMAAALAGPALAGPPVQEHSYAPADIQAGQVLYQGNCAGCHGQAGDAVEGADLGTGRFRRGGADEDLIRIIRGGLPGTSMPPHEFLSVGDARTIVAFLRSLPAGGMAVDEAEVRIGDAARGRAVFEGRGECTACHGIDGQGAMLAPDLGRAGIELGPATIERAILDPSAEVRAGNRFYQVVLAGGETVTGRLLNQDTHSIQMMSDGRLVAFLKADLRGSGFVPSPMPSYRDELSGDEVADLVAYLLTLGSEDAP